MSKYPKLNDGEGFTFDPTETYLRFACCDCGLVHEFAFDVKGKKELLMAMQRQKRATAQLRRHNYGFLQRPLKKGRYKLVKV